MAYEVNTYHCYQQYPCENKSYKPDDPLGFTQRGAYAYESISAKQCMRLESLFEAKVSLSSMINFVINVAFRLISI